MAVAEHVVSEPAWIRALVEDVLVDAFHPLGFIGPLGYRWWEPSDTVNPFDGWQLVVYPTPSEVQGPHAQDGSKFVSGFRLDVGLILRSMAGVEMVAWNSPARYNGDLDGPELSVRGLFAGKRVWLRVFHVPPPDEPCCYCVNPTSGEAWERPA